MKFRVALVLRLTQITFFRTRARKEAAPLGVQEPLPDGRRSDRKNVVNSETLYQQPVEERDTDLDNQVLRRSTAATGGGHYFFNRLLVFA